MHFRVNGKEVETLVRYFINSLTSANFPSCIVGIQIVLSPLPIEQKQIISSTSLNSTILRTHHRFSLSGTCATPLIAHKTGDEATQIAAEHSELPAMSLSMDVKDDSPDQIGPSTSPRSTFSGKAKRFAKAFTTKDGLIGTYDYAFLFTPNIPFMKRQRRAAPFFGLNQSMPVFLALLLGFQHALSM